MTEILIIAAIVLVALPGVLFYLLQHKLVFAPNYYPERSMMLERAHAYHLQNMDVVPGITLEGIVYEPDNPSSTVLYFGGKEQDSVALIGKFSQYYPDLRLIAFNYRGYGASKGRPTQHDILEDALKIYDWCEREYGDTILFGYSLGSSVAAFIGTQRRTKLVVLVSAFDSVAALIKAKLPVPNFIIRHRFDTAVFVQNILSPLYLYVTEDDLVVPVSHARNLKNNVKNLAEYKEFSGYDHTELLFSDELVEKLKEVFAK